MQNDRDRGPWFQTYTGGEFYPLDPDPDDVRLIDIAHALSNVCRFGGHCREFYSVAQHSVLCSTLALPEDAMWALFHDAAEAYIGDMVRPLKRTSGMREFCFIEDKILAAIARKFGLTWPMPETVKVIDTRILFTEKRDLRDLPGKTDPKQWDGVGDYPPYEMRIQPWTPELAKQNFLARYSELAEERDRMRCDACAGRGFTLEIMIVADGTSGVAAETEIEKSCAQCSATGRAR